MEDLHQDDWAHDAGYRIIEIDEFNGIGVDSIADYQTDPIYANDPCRQAVIVNVKIALPYIRNSVLDATDHPQIDLCEETNYESNPIEKPVMIKLRKD